MSSYYDREGNPLADVSDFARLFENPRYQTVRKTRVGAAVISTVWLGINHNFTEGAPIIFETMVFGGSLDQEQNRYSTEEHAIAGHAAMVGRVIEIDGGEPEDITEKSIAHLEQSR